MEVFFRARAITPHLFGILCSAWFRIDDPEAVVVLPQDGHKMVASENEKFRPNLLVSDLGSYLRKSLCSDLI